MVGQSDGFSQTDARRCGRFRAVVSPRPTASLLTGWVAVLAVAAAASSPAAAQDRPLAADFPEVYRVGGFDAPDWALFSRPGPLGFDRSGNLYVLDASAPQVVVIGADGQLAMTIGRAGEGPGEFDFVSDLVVWRDGRFAVFDSGRNGIHLFGADGEFERMVRWSAQQVSPLTLFAPVGRTMRPDPNGGSIYAQGALDAIGDIIGAFDALLGVEAKEKQGVDERGVERIDLSGDVVVAEPVLQGWRAPRAEPVDRVTKEDLMISASLAEAASAPMFFDPDLHWDILPDGTIAYSDSSGYVIKMARADGPVPDVLTRPLQPETVDQRIRSAMIDWAIRRLARTGEQMEEALDDPEMRAAMSDRNEARREQVQNQEFFAEIPIIRELRATWQGALWVQRRGEEPWDDRGPIDVFGPNRRYLATFVAGATEMPVAFGPDGLVAFWETDALDVPSIVVRRLPAGVR